MTPTAIARAVEQVVRYAAHPADLETWHRTLDHVYPYSTPHNRDSLPRLAFADFLEERGHPAVAQVVRWHQRQAEEDEQRAIKGLRPGETLAYSHRPLSPAATLLMPDQNRVGPSGFYGELNYNGAGRWWVKVGAPSRDHFIHHIAAGSAAEIHPLVQRLRDEGVAFPDAETPSNDLYDSDRRSLLERLEADARPKPHAYARAVRYAAGDTASPEDRDALLALVRAGRHDLGPVLADALEERNEHHDPETLELLRSGTTPFYLHERGGRWAARTWPRLTITDIRRLSSGKGNQMFRSSVMRMYGARLEREVHQGHGGNYVVESSDHPHHEGRVWKVYRFEPDNGFAYYTPKNDARDLPTDFGSREAAHAAARHLAVHGRLPDAQAEHLSRRGDRPVRYSTHEAFHDELRRNPHNRLPALVYADWLEDQGQSGYAHLIRLHQQAAERVNGRAYDLIHKPSGAGVSPTVGVAFGGTGSPHVTVLHPVARDLAISFGATMPLAEVHSLLVRMEGEGVRAAGGHRQRLEEYHPHLRNRQQMSRRTSPAKMARQIPLYSAEHLHPELRFTRLGAVLRQVASSDPTSATDGHFDTVIGLARNAIEHAGPHDKPMDLLPLGVLRDYMLENPDHPLAQRFNWERLPEKVALDRTVRGRRHRLYDWNHILTVPADGDRNASVYGFMGVDEANLIKKRHPWVSTEDVRDSARRLKNQNRRGDMHHYGYGSHASPSLTHPESDEHAEPAERYSRPQVSGVANAFRLLRSRNQQQTRAVASQVLRSLNLSPYKLNNAVTTGPAPVASVLASVDHGGDESRGEAAAAYMGHLLQLPAVTAFHTDDDGPDAVHSFVISQNPQAVAQQLQRADISRAALSPQGNGTRVLIHDPGARIGNDVLAQITAGQAAGVRTQRGRSVSFGHSAGHRADASARKTYRDVMAAWEAKVKGPQRMSRPTKGEHAALAEAVRWVVSTPGSLSWTPNRRVRLGKSVARIDHLLRDGKSVLGIHDIGTYHGYEGQGHMKRLLAAIHAANPTSHTVVSTVTNPVLADYLRRNEWEPDDEHEGYALPTTKPVKMARLPRNAVRVSELKPWAAAIREKPTDRITSGAFADWLEERGFHHSQADLDRLRAHAGPLFVTRHPTSRKVVAVPTGTPEDLDDLRSGHYGPWGRNAAIYGEPMFVVQGPRGDVVVTHNMGHHRAVQIDRNGAIQGLYGNDGYSLESPRPLHAAVALAVRHAFGD